MVPSLSSRAAVRQMGTEKPSGRRTNIGGPGSQRGVLRFFAKLSHWAVDRGRRSSLSARCSGPATAAQLGQPTKVRAGPDNSMYIAETTGHVVRRVGPEGNTHAVAGTPSLVWNGQLKRDAHGAPAIARDQSRKPRWRSVAKLPLVELRPSLIETRIELQLGTGRRLKIPAGFDVESLRRPLSVLETRGVVRTGVRIFGCADSIDMRQGFSRWQCHQTNPGASTSFPSPCGLQDGQRRDDTAALCPGEPLRPHSSVK